MRFSIWMVSILFACVLSSQNITLVSKFSIPAHQKKFKIFLDRFDQIYLLFPSGELIKYSMSGKKLYSSQNLPPASDWIVSTENPFKITFYSPSFQQLFMFDQQLSTLEKIQLSYSSPLDILKLTFRNTFIAYCSSTHELIEFSLEKRILQQKQLDAEFFLHHDIVDIFSFKENYLLLTCDGQLYSTTFEGKTNLLNIDETRSVFIKEDNIVVVSEKNILLYDFVNKKRQEAYFFPAECSNAISNGNIVACLKNDSLFVYTLK